MNKLKFLLSSLFILSVLLSQAQVAEKGDKILNLGFGFGNNYTAGGSDFSNSFLPVSASFEIIVNDDIFNDGNGSVGIGGLAGFMTYKYTSTAIAGGLTENMYGLSSLKSAVVSSSVSEWKYNKFIIGPRANLHYNFVDNLDTYTSVILGLDYVAWKSNSDYKQTHAGFYWSWLIGGRYYFTDNFAVMLEAGYGATYLNIGIAYKFKN